MTTEVVLTGTGTPIADADRAGPSTLIRRGGTSLLFDAGRAVVPRLTAAGVGVTDLTAVFVTHHHSDHLTGLPDLTLTRWGSDRFGVPPALPVIAPEGPACSFVQEMLVPWRHDLEVRKRHTKRSDDPAVDLRPFLIQDRLIDDSLVEVWTDDTITVFAGPVRHEPVHPAVGYRIETPEGVVAITGDTVVCDEVATLARGADVLVYEAMRFSVVRTWPEHGHFVMDYHADTALIGVQAAELGVPTLVLTHLIPAPTTKNDEQGYIDEVRSGGFTGTIVVARDLDVVTL